MIELDHIYNMDCLEGMQMIPDGTVDAVICDLPYSVLHKDNPNVQWDRIIPMEPLWAQYKRVIKDNGAILLFCQGMFTAQLMMSQPKLWRYNPSCLRTPIPAMSFSTTPAARARPVLQPR